MTLQPKTFNRQVAVVSFIIKLQLNLQKAIQGRMVATTDKVDSIKLVTNIAAVLHSDKHASAA